MSYYIHDDGNGWSLLYDWVKGCMAFLEQRHVNESFGHCLTKEHYGFNDDQDER